MIIEGQVGGETRVTLLLMVLLPQCLDEPQMTGAVLGHVGTMRIGGLLLVREMTVERVPEGSPMDGVAQVVIMTLLQGVEMHLGVQRDPEDQRKMFLAGSFRRATANEEKHVNFGMARKEQPTYIHPGMMMWVSQNFGIRYLSNCRPSNSFGLKFTLLGEASQQSQCRLRNLFKMLEGYQNWNGVLF